MATLYELASDMLALADRLTADDLSDADLCVIEANETALAEKAGGYIAISRNLDSEAEQMRAEARRLSELAARRERGAERLRARLAWCLDACKIERLPTPLGTVRVQAASRPTIRWEGNPMEFPPQFQRVKVELDGTKAYDAWRMTKALPEGFTVEFSRGIRVS